MDLLELYEKFLSLRSELIETALKQATYSEKRDTGNVRPLVILKSDIHLDEYERKINELDNIAKLLTKGDPVRFKATAKIFNPAPAIYKDVYRIDVRESESTSQQKIEKRKIIKRMYNLLEAERHNARSTGDNSPIERIRAEIDTMENDGEEFYLRRASGYKDVRVLIYLSSDSKEPIKVSLSFAGIYVKPSKDAPENFISLPEQSRQLVERSDKFDISGITMIKHSLAMRGKLYKYSEYEAAKKQAKTPPAP